VGYSPKVTICAGFRTGVDGGGAEGSWRSAGWRAPESPWSSAGCGSPECSRRTADWRASEAPRRARCGRSAERPRGLLLYAGRRARPARRGRRSSRRRRGGRLGFARLGVGSAAQRKRRSTTERSEGARSLKALIAQRRPPETYQMAASRHKNTCRQRTL